MSASKVTARMKRKLAVRAMALAVVILFSSSARAGFRPSFDYDSATWAATDVVLVEATATPGTFKVIRSFKGNLVAGGTIRIPELISPKDAELLGDIVKAPDNWDADEWGLSGSLPAEPAGSAGGAPFTIGAGDGLSLYGCRILRFLKGADFDFTLRILCFDGCRSSRWGVRRFGSPH